MVLSSTAGIRGHHRACPAAFRQPMMRIVGVVLLAGLTASPPGCGSSSGLLSGPAVSPSPVVSPGDCIAIIGNTLADRMQHFGYTEALLQAKFPGYRLVIRNLGFSGDTLTERPRCDGFGSPDHWLSHVGADVIIACFGYNESFAGAEGLSQFQANLESFVGHTLSRRYNGRTPPRLVLVSPVPHEDLRNRHLPDGRQNNGRLELYVDVMRSTAARLGVPFVDLFSTWPAAPGSTGPWTINGIHLTDAGYRLAGARIADSFVAAAAAAPAAAGELESVRRQVLAGNRIWRNIYRVSDGYSVYGGRSELRYVNGQSNFEVLQREREILEAMAGVADRRIWAVAEGSDVFPDDGNLPEPLSVTSNKPGPLPDGSHRFSGGEAALAAMTVHSGMQAGLFASEEQFPELVNPAQSAVDPDGRLWVAVWPSYPHWHPRDPMDDKLLILPDDDGDGRADRVMTFADGLHNPTAFEFWNGGVVVAMAPEIVFLKDTDGDDVCDVREHLIHGLDSADTHHAANSLVMGPNGRFYYSRGIFLKENSETPWGPPFRSASDQPGVYEFDPLRFDLGRHFPLGPNPHGIAFDPWGRQFAADAASGTVFQISFPGRTARSPLTDRRVRPVPAITVLDSVHFPDTVRGDLLVAGVIGFQGVARYHLVEHGAGMRADEREPLLYSTDPNFRPTDLEIGGDGALYVLDWQNPLIGHLEHHLRDPGRDNRHGRVYRITAEGRALQPVRRMMRRPVPEVVQHLGSAAAGERYRACLELTGRDSAVVTAAVRDWVRQFAVRNPAHAMPLLQALWVHQQHRVPDPELLWELLGSPEARVRAAAVRVLAEWHASSDGDAWLMRLAADPDPAVRAESVVAAARINGPRAAEVLFAAEQHPVDDDLAYILAEARQIICPGDYIHAVLVAGQPLSAAARAHALRNSPVGDLLLLGPGADVGHAILSRAEAPLPVLQQTLDSLAEQQGVVPLALLFELLEQPLQPTADATVTNVGRLLLRQPLPELRRVRDRIIALTAGSGSRDVRQLGWAALITADENADAAFWAASDSQERQREILGAIPLIVAGEAQSAVLQSLRSLLTTPVVAVREDAIDALLRIPGRETEKAAELITLADAGISARYALGALAELPTPSWPEAQLPSLAESILRVLRDALPQERNSPDVAPILGVAAALAERFPPEQASRFRQQVDLLRIPLVEISTVANRMIFSQERVVVQAGRPVEFRLFNSDSMPHNFAIVTPGALQQVGELAEATAQDPDAARRQFVPQTDSILAASSLLQPGEAETVWFETPAAPGVYSYLCTYPGHWRRMFGALYVVSDLASYAADPESCLASEVMRVRDPLLNSLRRSREWTLDDFRDDLQHLVHRDNNFAVGQQLFRLTGCVGCHGLAAGAASGVGPDLRRLPPDYGPMEVLDQILNPSRKIDSRFRSSSILLRSGRRVTGLVVSEIAGEVRLMEHPLRPEDFTTIEAAEIEARTPHDLSMMPQGLLNQLTREEVLDLLAFVLSGGNRRHQLFLRQEHTH